MDHGLTRAGAAGPYGDFGHLGSGVMRHLARKEPTVPPVDPLPFLAPRDVPNGWTTDSHGPAQPALTATSVIWDPALCATWHGRNRRFLPWTLFPFLAPRDGPNGWTTDSHRPAQPALTATSVIWDPALCA